MTKSYLQHLKSAKDLETTYEAYRAGFIALALEKNRRATPFVTRARSLKTDASRAKTPMDLLTIKEIQPALLTASGISDKARRYFRETEGREAILGLIRNFLEPAGADFVEELVYRFLLTRGDTLGGSMRNIAGNLAQKKLSRFILARLKNAGKGCQWQHSETKTWAELPKDDTDIELHLRGLSWNSPQGPRTLIYNLTVPLFGNNVDLSLFNCAAKELTKETVREPSAYLALGELKGGIDPQGADEHWKTARTALNRIHEAFKQQRLEPHRFFIGAAIEKKMSLEVWGMLNQGSLENAANLTDDDQVASITRWLCSL